MSENSSEQEPSIEEILASIRQIISDDDEEETTDSQEAEEVVESPIHDKTNDVLELTEEDLVEDPKEELAEMEIDMVDSYDELEPEPEAKVEEEPEAMTEEPAPQDIIDEIRQTPKTVPSDILSTGTQAAALSSITKLASKMPINSPRSYDGVTLEDIVREMLHPMLREWMDDNLPPMVERIVQKELEKLARRAMDD